MLPCSSRRRAAESGPKDDTQRLSAFAAVRTEKERTLSTLEAQGKKISTSRNWAVWLHEYLEDFPDQQDVLRYVLCTTAPENKDNDFTWKEFQARNNNELVAIFGNFINRVFVLCHKYWDGKIPGKNHIENIDAEMIKKIEEAPRIIGNYIDDK